MRSVGVRVTVVATALTLGLLTLGLLTGCRSNSGPDPTVPPTPPVHRIAGSVLPTTAGGYTALGSGPSAGSTQATYSANNNPLNLVVVSFDPTGAYGKTSLSNQHWYGESRCGILWSGNANATPQPKQAACITPLTDGVMTVVAAGDQTPDQLASVANAIAAGLAS